jgi:carboxypeptidase Taq
VALYVELLSDSSIAPALEQGDYGPLKSWLTENVWRHGRRYTRDELLVRATGRPMEAAPYIAYLQKKHGVDVMEAKI